MSPYMIFFGVLAAVCAFAYYYTHVQSAVTFSEPFRAFQRSFLIVYVTMMMSDWMQGPYVYALYDSYGFSKGQIGQLFIVGFGASMLVGTFVGSFADKYGRRNNCLLFVVLYAASCITKHFNDFYILLLGRLLGGVATSILSSAFETWMIHEHRSRTFPEDWLSSTFSLMTSLGSGLIAIAAGLVASFLSDAYGYVAPFDGALVLLLAGGAYIMARWTENYGDHARVDGGAAAPPAGNFDNFSRTWQLLLTNERVLLLGVLQSSFESSMYIFVFMWTPALEAGLKAAAALTGAPPVELPHGVVFATFMVCIMLGSKVFELAIRALPVENFARWLFVLAAASLATPMVTSHHATLLVAFCVFEFCCGIYFPCAGTMRSKYIPEEVRSTVMNVFRVGLNVIVVATLVNIEYMEASTVFGLTVALLCVAVFCQHRLFLLADAGAKAGAAPASADSTDDASGTTSKTIAASGH